MTLSYYKTQHAITQVTARTSSGSRNLNSQPGPGLTLTRREMADSKRRAAVDLASADATVSARRNGRKPQLSDLPQALQKPFNDRFIPLVRQYLGLQQLWSKVPLSNLEAIYQQAFGEELAHQYPLVEKDIVSRLVSASLNGNLSRLHAKSARASSGSRAAASDTKYANSCGLYSTLR